MFRPAGYSIEQNASSPSSRHHWIASRHLRPLRRPPELQLRQPQPDDGFLADHHLIAILGN